MSAFYRVTASNATHGIAKAFLSVCLSVKRVHCDKTKEPCAAQVFIYHMTERLSFTTRRMVGGDDPLFLKFWAKLTQFEQKCRFSIDICYKSPAATSSEKVQLTLIRSPLRDFQ